MPQRRGRKPGTPKTGGRKVGTPNRATVEKAFIAEQQLQKARAEAKPLGKEMLERFMLEFAAMSELYRPEPGKTPTPDQALHYERWARASVYCAIELTPFQSPQLKALMVPPGMADGQPKVTRFRLTIFDKNRGDHVIEQEQPLTALGHSEAADDDSTQGP